MSDRFAAAATVLCGQTAWLLGWRPGDFWAATPAELAAIFAVRAADSPGVSRADFTSLLERESDG